ncbi:MAG: HAD-IIIC family phosphatase [Candidatus Aminicenantes bacterium]|jgi:FkbH-like protein
MYKDKGSKGEGSPSKNKLKAIELVTAATFSAAPVNEHIKWWGEQFGYDINITLAQSKDVVSELADENSIISKNEGINALLIRFEDWIRGDDSSDLKKVRTLERQLKKLIKLFKGKHKPVPYFVGIFPVSTHLSFSKDLVEHIEQMYGRWQKALKDMDNVYAMDFTRLKELYAAKTVFDPETDKKHHLPFSNEFYAAMGTTIARKIIASTKNPFKVIVLDCDNTLWKGIVGEDGPTGIKVEGPFKALQQFMIQKYNEGFVLALCSKNNEPDVWEAFEKNPGMLLKKDHLVHWKINWGTKSSNMEAMARELNLGIDSFVFIDDNPVECAEVMTDSPKVLSLRLPEETASIPRWLDHIWAFDKIKVTEEDKKRTEMYKAEKQRQSSQKESQSLLGFLESLELKISLNKMKPHQVPRVSQLTQRTNQFNLSTIRRKEDDILKLEKEPGTSIWVMEVSDKFGDYGLVGVIISKEKGDILFVDTLLLSCRALGRGAELAVLAGLRRYSLEKGLKAMEALYYPTAKNKPILEYMEEKWVKQEDREDQKRFVYPFDQCSESIDFVDFYYLEDYKKEHDNQTQPSQTSADKEAMTEAIETDAETGETIGEHRWSVEKVNTENLLHKKYLLPLENYTAKSLLEL